MSFYSSLDSRALDADAPTLFEIISSRELDSLISPSLKFILVHYTRQYPRYLLKIYSKFDEINLLLRLAVEYLFLSKLNSTFTERFYAIKQTSKRGLQFKNSASADTQFLQQSALINKRNKLSKTQIWGTLIFLLGGPYLKEKLDVLYERIHSDYLVNRHSYSFRGKKNVWKLLFLKIYPIINGGVLFANILLHVLYISGKSLSPSLATYILNVKYSRVSGEPTLQAPISNSNVNSDGNQDIAPKIRPLSLGESIKYKVLNRLYRPLQLSAVSVFENVFPMLMFSLKFLEWWQQNDLIKSLFESNDNFIKEAVQTVKQLPAPRRSFQNYNANTSNATIAEKNKANNSNSNNNNNKYNRNEYDTCAICKNEIHNHAIIETGYVFCYPCIINYLQDVKNDGRCPISGRKLTGCYKSEDSDSFTVENIRKLMV